MTFENLPENPRSQPVDDEQFAADLVDLFISERARSAGAILIGLGDEQGCVQQPIVIDDVPPQADPDQVADFVDLLAREFGLQSLLFARGRTGSAAPTDLDRAWHQRIIDICRIHRIRLLGAFVATPGAVVPLPAPLQQAS